MATIYPFHIDSSEAGEEEEEEELDTINSFLLLRCEYLYSGKFIPVHTFTIYY